MPIQKWKPVRSIDRRKRTVYGLKAYVNPETGFKHDRVETKDYQARAFVFCSVQHPEGAYPLIFGWLAEGEPESFRGDSVQVQVMMPEERKELRAHFNANATPNPLRNAQFW